VRPNRAGGEAAHRDHGLGSEDDPPPAGNQSALWRFLRDESNPLACDLLVVDETSMVDVPLMHSLMRGCSEPRRTDFGRDVDQLPSLAGTVLQDLIESSGASRASHEVFRQAAGSQIINQRARIAEARCRTCACGPDSDFISSRGMTREDRGNVVKLVQERIQSDSFRPDPRRAGSCPMNRGSLGVRELNNALQRREPYAIRPVLCGSGSGGGPRWATVIQTENDYDKEVFNGDIESLTGSIRSSMSYDSLRRTMVKYDFGGIG